MLIKIIALLLVSISSFCIGYFVKDIKGEIYEIDVTPWSEDKEEE